MAVATVERVGRYDSKKSINALCWHKMNLVVAERFRALRECACEFVVVGGNAVPLVGSGHEVHTMAHGRLHDDYDGFTAAGAGSGLAKGSAYGVEVVAVFEVHDVPSKGGKLGAEVAHREYFVGAAINLLAVGVHCGDEVVDFFGASVHSGFPNLAFL